MKLSALQSDFLIYLKRDLGRSEKTVASYGRYLEAFLAQTGITDSAKLSLSAIDSFQQHLRKPVVGPTGHVVTRTAKTQNYYLIALRSFLKYLKLRGVSVPEPREIQLINQVTAPASVVTTKEIARLQKSQVKGNSPIDLRDRAVIELLLATGIQVHELCALDLNDVSFKKARCTVTNNRGQVRTLSLSRELITILKGYLRVRRDTDTALFVQFGKNSHNAQSVRLSPRTVQRIVRQRSVAAGITTPLTPKSLRLSVATTLERAGEPLLVIQTKLGHKHEASTAGLLQRGVATASETKHK